MVGDGCQHHYCLSLCHIHSTGTQHPSSSSPCYDYRHHYCLTVNSISLTRPNLALSLGVLIHILTFIIPNNSINRTSESSTGYSFTSKMAMGLVPNVNLIWGIKMLMSAESKGSGLQWANLFTRGEPDDPLTMGAVWLMFLFDCFLFSLIILYIDTVAPGKFGVARPWYFPVMGLCRNGTVTSEEVSPRRLDDDMFEVEPSGEAGVRVKHLRKEFPRWGQDPVKAVQDVSFAAFPGKITLPSWPSTCTVARQISIITTITNHHPYHL